MVTLSKSWSKRTKRSNIGPKVTCIERLAKRYMGRAWRASDEVYEYEIIRNRTLDP